MSDVFFYEGKFADEFGKIDDFSLLTPIKHISLTETFYNMKCHFLKNTEFRFCKYFPYLV